MNQSHSTLQKPVSVAVVVRGGVVQSTHANVPGVGVTVYDFDNLSYGDGDSVNDADRYESEINALTPFETGEARDSADPTMCAMIFASFLNWIQVERRHLHTEIEVGYPELCEAVLHLSGHISTTVNELIDWDAYQKRHSAAFVIEHCDWSRYGRSKNPTDALYFSFVGSVFLHRAHDDEWRELVEQHVMPDWLRADLAQWAIDLDMPLKAI